MKSAIFLISQEVKKKREDFSNVRLQKSKNSKIQNKKTIFRKPKDVQLHFAQLFTIFKE